MADTDIPPTAADALAIIDKEKSRAQKGLTPDLVVMHAAWGLAYVLGGVLYFLHRTGSLSGLVTVVAAVVLLAGAVTVSTIAAVRSSRGVASTSAAQGALYGSSWPVAMVLTAVLAVGSSANLLPGTGSVVIPALFVFVAGLLYLAGGVVWPSGPQYACGAWVMVVAAGSVFVPAPANVLVLGVGSGAGLIAVAVRHATRRSRR